MNEDYVSYASAMLLKEKKFMWRCDYCYDKGKEDKLSSQPGISNEGLSIVYAAPTLYAAQKWLREQHGVYIDIIRVCNEHRGFEMLYGYVVTTYMAGLATKKHSNGFISDYKTNLDLAVQTALTMI